MYDFEDRPIHRVRNPVYELSLSIYTVAECGEDLQGGSPHTVSAKGEDLYELKRGITQMILSAIENDGKCFVEMMITEDDKYFDRDEWWCEISHKENKIEGGKYDSQCEVHFPLEEW